MLISWLTTVFLAAPQGPAFVVKNPSSDARDELVRASLPLPAGRFDDLPTVGVDGRRAPTLPLLRWPDGSLAVVQVQARVRLRAGERRRFAVDLAPEEEEAAAAARKPETKPETNTAAKSADGWFLQGALPLRTELEDPWGAVYRASFVPDATAGDGGLMSATSRVRTRRYRSIHRAGEKSYFGLVAYVTTVRGIRHAEMTLMLDNRSRTPRPKVGVAPALGPARFRSFRLVIEGDALKVRPRFIHVNAIRPPIREGENWHQRLLGPSDQLYLGDRTAKTWRFDLFLDGEGVTAAHRDAARLAADFPLRPVPDLKWTRHTRAFGAHGGPAPGPGEPKAESVWMRFDWRSRAAFGPFRGCGDLKNAAANGTPRNGPCSLHNAIRYGSGPLVGVAEAMVLQQSLRPTPGVPPRLPVATAALRQGMSKRTMHMPHGFTALDYEHFSVDLLYDYYWLTGDAFSRDEMARLGHGLRSVLSNLPFLTSRGEGWCMQSAVLISRATADRSLVDWMHERFRREVEGHLGRSPKPYLIRQPPHRDALDGHTAFDCPWQMAAFVHGAHAMFRQTGDARYAAAGVRAGRVMAGPGWSEEQGPKYLVAATDAGRYSMPVGFGPLEGTALMEVGGFILAGEMADKTSDKDLFRRRAATLVAPYEAAERSRTAMNPWFQLYLDRKATGSLEAPK